MTPFETQQVLHQGTRHHQANQLPQAQACYQQILRQQPNHPDALHLLGVLAHQTGHLPQAEAMIRRAIAGVPHAAPFHTSLGHVLRAQHRAQDAEAAYRLAVRAAPNAAEAHHHLGLALNDQGRTKDAEAAFRQALRLNRDFGACRLDLGNLLLETGHPTDAEAIVRAALRTTPDHPQLLNALGLSLIAQAKHRAALAAFDDTLRVAPQYQTAAINRAHCLRELEEYEAAEAAYASLSAAAPDDMDLRLAHANTLVRLKRGAQAAALLAPVLAVQPDHVDALHDLARAYALQDRADLALPCLQTLCARSPENAQAWFELGMAYRDLARWPDAVAPHAEAVRLAPENPHYRSCYAYALLANGDFAQGWQEFRWRTRKPGNVRLREPEWDGLPTDKTVIIHAEQGIGDTLQFCRFIPRAAALARVVVACPPSLKTLMEGLPGVAQVAVGKPVPDYDMHVPLMGLAALFHVEPHQLAATVPYLHADAARVAVWRDRLAALPGPRVGMVWAGNPQYPLDRKRSVPFAALAPLLAVPGVSFVSMQMGPAAAEADGCFAFDAAPLVGDYADTAALIGALDLVISVDTSVAHLAGALGAKVWLLNRADTDWRWLVDREDSPWYPSLVVFRQPEPGDWETVVASVAARLYQIDVHLPGTTQTK